MYDHRDFYRNIVPSPRSAYVIDEKFLNRKAYIIAEGTKLLLIVNKNLLGEYEIYSKLFLDGLVDSINSGETLEDRLSRFLQDLENNQNNFHKFIYEEIIDYIVENGMVIDFWNSGLDLCPEVAKRTIEEWFSYNMFVGREIKNRDLAMIYGVTKTENTFYTQLRRHPSKPLFMIRPTQYEAKELFNMFSTIDPEIEIELVGSLGRGEHTGHDIDLLIRNKYKKDVDNILKVHQKVEENRYAIDINGILTQVDITYWMRGDNHVVTKFHCLGPKEKNISYAVKARRKGYKLGNKNLTELNSNKNINITSQEELLNLLNDTNIKFSKAIE